MADGRNAVAARDAHGARTDTFGSAHQPVAELATAGIGPQKVRVTVAVDVRRTHQLPAVGIGADVTGLEAVARGGPQVQVAAGTGPYQVRSCVGVEVTYAADPIAGGDVEYPV